MNKEDQILAMLNTLNDTVTKIEQRLTKIEHDLTVFKKQTTENFSSLTSKVTKIEHDLTVFKKQTAESLAHLDSQTTENAEMLKAVKYNQETSGARVYADEVTAAKLDNLEKRTVDHTNKFDALKIAVS